MADYQTRKNGRITARVRRHGVVASETFTTRSAAESWARKTESEVERGLWLDTSEADRTTVADLCIEYKRRVLPGLKGKHAGPAVRSIELSDIAKLTLSRLTARAVVGFRDSRLQTVSNETVRKELGTLSKLVDLAMRELGINLPANPVKQVTRPPAGRGRERRLMGDEEARLFESLAQCRSPYMLPLAKMALATAARQGELLKMRWADADLTRRFILLRATKNGEDRAMPLSSAALAVLESLPRSIDGRIFPVTQSLVIQAWGHACKRAGLVDLRYHDLRHEALSRMAERGGLSVLELASVSGHKTLQMLKRYTHLHASDLAKKLG
ncbi:MAG: site-specific integrase [Rugosibacter sp.]